MTTASVVWLLPVVFMLHELEEAILLLPWLEHRATELQRRFPRFAAAALARARALSSASFTLVVAEELVLVAAVTLVSAETGALDPWAGLLVALAAHFLVHLAQAAVYRGYIPVAATSALGLGYALWALSTLDARGLLRPGAVAVWAVVLAGAMLANFLLMHRVATRFEERLRRGTVPGGPGSAGR